MGRTRRHRRRCCAAPAKAFCAGGDIRALYDSFHAGAPLRQRFFVDEYRLDYALHRYPNRWWR